MEQADREVPLEELTENEKKLRLAAMELEHRANDLNRSMQDVWEAIVTQNVHSEVFFWTLVQLLRQHPIDFNELRRHLVRDTGMPRQSDNIGHCISFSRHLEAAVEN